MSLAYSTNKKNDNDQMPLGAHDNYYYKNDSHHDSYHNSHHGWGWSWGWGCGWWCWLLWCTYIWFLIAWVVLLWLGLAGVFNPSCTDCPSDMQALDATLCIDLLARGPDYAFANVVNDCAERGLTLCPATAYDTCESLEAQVLVPFNSDCGDPASIGGALDDLWTGDFTGPPSVGDHTCVSGDTFTTRINCDTGTSTDIFWHCCAPRKQCAS